MIDSHEKVRAAREKITEIHYELSHKQISHQDIPEALALVEHLQTEIERFQKVDKVKLASENGEQV